MSPEEEIARAGRASQLLEEPLIQEAFSLMEDALLTGIQTSALKDNELREKCCQYLTTLRQVKQHLKSTMETGKFAAKQLEQKTFWDQAKNVVGIR